MVVISLSLLVYILVDKYSIDIYLSQMGQEDTADNPTPYIEKVRTAMLEGQQDLMIYFKGDETEVNDFASNALEEAFSIDEKETSSDFDYIRMKYSGMKVIIKGMGNIFTVAYQFDYIESKEQTEQVDEAVKLILGSMKVQDSSDYDKIKAIHDYIINNASYDMETEKNAAYDNLIGKKSVCQGYAALVYKMMTEANIACRVITGTGKGVSHAWNIVKIDRKWYNVDCTWDDPVSETGENYLQYDYFLKSDNEFSDHIRDVNYSTPEFHNEYPMAEKSYKMK